MAGETYQLLLERNTDDIGCEHTDIGCEHTVTICADILDQGKESGACDTRTCWLSIDILEGLMHCDVLLAIKPVQLICRSVTTSQLNANKDNSLL